MVRIPIGTKTFGAIKAIESTPLITQFFMIGLLVEDIINQEK